MTLHLENKRFFYNGAIALPFFLFCFPAAMTWLCFPMACSKLYFSSQQAKVMEPRDQTLKHRVKYTFAAFKLMPLGIFFTVTKKLTGTYYNFPFLKKNPLQA